ncbi:MAG: S-layer homology domain-containing protein, partial [Epulopiscium sp.]|nr:S-layer homology domain-containing protein [Candidatus Epulonipiscium sp.]
MYKSAKARGKKVIGGILCGLLMAGQLLLPQAPGMQEVLAAPFTMGTQNHWAEQYMRKLFDEGIMRGDINGNMNPDRKITRAEFVSIINRAFGYKVSGKNPFKDVKGTEWYANDLSIAYQQGYFSGSGKNMAEPMSNLTREQAVTLLCRNLNLEGENRESFRFQDSRNFQSWSREAINAATQKNVVAGYKDGTFRPSNSIT